MTSRGLDRMRRHAMSRRHMLQAGLAGLSAASMAGCDVFSTQPAEEGESAERGSARGQQEAPMLADRVEAGELPSLAERLPESPLVLTPVDRVGVYGGEWNTIFNGPGDHINVERTMGYENLVRFEPNATLFDLTEVIPNVADSFEVIDDGVEYSFTLRRGMRWSDGEPFSADDIMFWYNDVLLNEELTPVLPATFRSAEEPVTVEKVNDYSVVFRFAQPNGLFLLQLARVALDNPTSYPAHYLKEFHPTYNPDAAEQAQEEGFTSWVEWFASKAEYWSNVERPVLYAWKLTTSLGDATDRMVAERNPYYWKVDPGGAQLPYIDRVVYHILTDTEVMVLRAAEGQIDMQPRHFTTPANRPVLAQSRQSGGYEFFHYGPAEPVFNIFFNITHRDQAMREVFANKDFRIGISHAINRQEIIDTVYQRQGEPSQSAPLPDSGFYDEEMAKQYTEYDTGQAEEFLDRVLPDKDADGRRLGPDGRPFTFSCLVTRQPVDPVWPEGAELISEDLAQVGITLNVDHVGRELHTARREDNEFDVTVFGGYGVGVILEPQLFFPGQAPHFAGPWARWYQQGGLDGDVKVVPGVVEEPAEPARRQMELYEQIRGTADPERQAELMRQILQIAKEEFWNMAISLGFDGYGIVKKDFRNLPRRGLIEAAFAPLASRVNAPLYFVDQ